MIIDKIKKEDFSELVDRCSPYIKIDKNKAYHSILEIIKANNDKSKLSSMNKVVELEDRWYRSLEMSPDYSVYNDPYYICDVWTCWKIFSRKALMDINSKKSLNGISVVDMIGEAQKVLDLGCGFGYTTAGLKELFPNAEVIATNLEESYQFNIASDLGERYGFKVIPSNELAGEVDVLFASEYFEHIERPLEHLLNVFKHNKPRVMILANSFNAKAIGHFNHYKHFDNTYTNKAMNRMFNSAMKKLGYRKLDTKIWNNRPSIWVRKRVAG